MTRSIEIGKDLVFGKGNFNIIAGPCSVEGEGQLDELASFLSSKGIKLLRGGAFKPRTSPDSFQGIGYEGYKILARIAKKYGMYVVSEVMDPRDLESALDYVDIVQVGTRNMYNYSLLKELGKIERPVLLKRGMSAKIDEWIKASEYIKSGGNDNIIMCERGIRTFEDYTRNTLDLMAVAIIKKETGLPVIVDPSHGTGRRDLILPAVKAAKAIGADGVMVEVHPRPEEALSDGEQSLNFRDFQALLESI